MDTVPTHVLRVSGGNAPLATLLARAGREYTLNANHPTDAAILEAVENYEGRTILEIRGYDPTVNPHDVRDKESYYFDYFDPQCRGCRFQTEAQNVERAMRNHYDRYPDHAIGPEAEDAVEEAAGDMSEASQEASEDTAEYRAGDGAEDSQEASEDAQDGSEGATEGNGGLLSRLGIVKNKA